MSLKKVTSTILVVDDEPANLMVAEGALSPLGYTIITAPDTAAARKILEATRPDLMLLDVNMPGQTGIEACAQWRAEGLCDDVPIVLLTALDPGEHRSQGLAAGADDYLRKPFDLDALHRMVRRWLATGRRAAAPESQDLAGSLAEAMHRAALGGRRTRA